MSLLWRVKKGVQTPPTGGGLKRVLSIFSTSSANATAVNASISVPEGEFWVVNTILIKGKPAATISLNGLFAFHQFPGVPAGSETEFLRARSSNTTNEVLAVISPGVGSAEWRGELYLPPNWAIVASATFSAAAIANTTDIHITGQIYDANDLFFSRAR